MFKQALHQNFFDVSKIFCVIQAPSSQADGDRPRAGHGETTLAFEPVTEPRSAAAARTISGLRRGRRMAVSTAAVLVTVAFTFLGLLAITFFIGRVIP